MVARVLHGWIRTKNYFPSPTNEHNIGTKFNQKGFLVSKETVVLHRWERSKQKSNKTNELIKVELPP